MNRILAIGCALAVIAAPTAAFAAPISLPQAPSTDSGLELVDAITMTTIADGTHVYILPDATSTVVSTLAAGTKVTVLDKTPDGMWARVQIDSGSGYVRVRTLK